MHPHSYSRLLTFLCVLPSISTIAGTWILIPTCSLGGLAPSSTCCLVETIVTQFSISMFGDSNTCFHGISALPNSCDPPIFPRTGTLFLHRSSNTTFSCFRLSMESWLPKQSKEKDSFQERSDLEEISRVLRRTLLLFPAER